MSMMSRSALVSVLMVAVAAPAFAQAPADGSGAPPMPQPPADPMANTTQPAPVGMYPSTMGVAASPQAEEKTPKEPKKGDFDAGGQVRLPSGPDEMGKFATFNWVALDLKARYFLLDSITANANIPLAVKKPGMLMDGTDPSMIGGFTTRLEAKIPHSQTGLQLTLGYMREGAMLLSEKDYPRFAGSFKPGVSTGILLRLKLGSLLDLALTPAVVYQSGTAESLTALQLPASVIIKLASLVQVSADLGIYTGNKFSFAGDKGGRIAAGGSLTVKLGPIMAHAGAGVASLITGGLYPTISDSVYIDLNVKYVK
jgi:hypothetical protein